MGKYPYPYPKRIVIYNFDGSLKEDREMTEQEIIEKQKNEGLIKKYLDTKNPELLWEVIDKRR